METVFTAVNYRRNEHGVCPGGVYVFVFDGQHYHSDHIADGPLELESSFVLDIELSESNLFAYRGADAIFYMGVTLQSGRFARSQAFAARLAL